MLTPPQVFTLPRLNSEEPTVLTILTTHNYLWPQSPNSVTYKLTSIYTMYLAQLLTSTHLSTPPSPLSHITYSWLHFILYHFPYISSYTDVCRSCLCHIYLVLSLSQVLVSEFSAVHIHILLPNCYNSLSAYQLYFGGLILE